MNQKRIDSSMPYLLRGDIPQDRTLFKDDDFGNVCAGWMKHLSVEDLCDVIAVARRNLPNVDFMYNDDYLTDPEKIPATRDLLGRIHQYEESHGVKLIDSIGTQMHIDNDVSSSDIGEMFSSLAEFGLPVEVTEFDMAMTSKVEGLSDSEIQLMRLEKINEIHELLEENNDDYNIRGFTIWSKTDSQNFRVYLENAIRLNRGLKPIRTLHGGYFDESMELKGNVFGKKQAFNYHTHTRRCGHASIADDSEYVKAAREQGIMRLGFSDHVPLSILEYPDLSSKMHISEVDDYLSSISALKNENPDMEILCGFEAEYDPMKKGFLGELRNDVDYLVLGQHYVKEGFKTVKAEAAAYYPLVYADSVCEAMKTGLFDIVAHPDMYMQYRDSFTTDAQRRMFDEASESAARKICETAADLGIPLEINLSNVSRNIVMEDGNYAYPHPLFWNIASEYDVKVLYGVDAHDPSQLTEMDALIDKVEENIDVENLNFVADDYNPVSARKNNPMLSALCEDSYSDSMTYESHLVYGLLSTAADSIGDDVTEDVGEILAGGLADTKEVLSVEAEGRIDRAKLKIEDISAEENMAPDEKNFALKRADMELKAIETTLRERSAVISRAIDAVNSATSMGCETPEEYVHVVTDLTEVRSQSDVNKAGEASERLVGFEQLHSTDIKANNNGYAGSVVLAIATMILAGMCLFVLYLFIR